MKKVLIVGANSYIGKSFQQYFRRCMNREVMPACSNMEVDMVSASNGDWGIIDYTKYDSVIMLSALVHQKERKSMEQHYQEVNCELPVAIAKKAKEAGVSQFIFMSTAAVYGSKVTRITKDTIPDPDTFYGKWKLEAERRLLKLEEDHYCIAIIRPPMVYGEGCKGNYQRLEQLARCTFFFPLIHNRRSMIHITSLCECMEKMILNNEKGIMLPQDTNYADTALLVKNLRSNMGKRTVLVPGTAWLIRLMMKRVGVLRKMFGDWYYDR